MDTSAGDPSEVTRSRFKARTTSSEPRPSRIGENRRRPTRSRCTCRDLHERAHNDKVRHAAGDPHFRTNETQTFKTLQALRLRRARQRRDPQDSWAARRSQSDAPDANAEPENSRREAPAKATASLPGHAKAHRAAAEREAAGQATSEAQRWTLATANSQGHRARRQEDSPDRPRSQEAPSPRNQSESHRQSRRPALPQEAASPRDQEIVLARMRTSLCPKDLVRCARQ